MTDGVRELFPARNGNYWRLYGKAGIKQATLMEMGYILHNSGTYEVQLKITDSKMNKVVLSKDEIDDLILFFNENYAAVKAHECRYIPIKDDSEAAVQALSILSDSKIVEEWVKSGATKNDVLLAMELQRRTKALESFKDMLTFDSKEELWQQWFTNNTWVFGSPYVKVLDERSIDENNEADYLLKSVDGFTDIAEIKRPKFELWKKDKHGNYSPRSELTEAITQCMTYMFTLDRKTFDSSKEGCLDSMIMKSKCLLIIGRSEKWDNKQKQSLRLLNSTLHGITIMTYDMVLKNAEQMLIWDQNVLNEVQEKIKS